MENKINIKLEKVLYFIKDYTKQNGYSPSIRDICSGLNISSTATVYYYITKLIKSGQITKSPSINRSIGVVNEEVHDEINKIPLVGVISAGTPILAVENIEEFYDIPNKLFKGADLFMLKVNGNSMIGAGIFDNDYIIVRQQNYANNKDIVVALIGEDTTVKRFFKEDDKIILHPENPTLDDIILSNVDILGVVVGSIRQF